MPMTKGFQIALILTVLGCLSFSANAQRHERTRILFVFDASYSMYGNLEQQSKISIAKDLLINLVDSLANKKDVQLGFRAYGHQSHRRKYDCEDTKLEVGFFPDNKQDIIRTLKGIEPKGTTPIAYSLEKAGNDFPDGPPARNVIILLTDGVEECRGDPCAVSQSLQRNNVTLKPFVIGIGIEKKYKQELNCMGRYFNASNKQQFKEALKVVISQAVNATSAQVNLLDVNGNATETDVNMTFYDAKQDIIRYNLYHTMDISGKPDTIYLDPSTKYDLQVHTTPPVWKKGIMLKAGEHNNIPLKAPMGQIDFQVNGDNIYGRLPMVVRRGAKDCRIINEQAASTSHRYLVGDYKVKILTNPTIHLDNVQVNQDQVNKITIPGPGKLYVSKSQNMVGSIYQMTDGKLEWVCDIKESVRRERVVLQPGQYRIVTRPSRAVKTEKTSEKTFQIQSGGATKINVK